MAAVGAAPAEDLVTNLPGYGALPFPMYSGFLSYTMSTGQQVRKRKGKRGRLKTNEPKNTHHLHSTIQPLHTIFVPPS